MKSLLPFLRHLAVGGALTSSALNAAESSLMLRMPPGWSGFELEATVETGYRPAGMTAPEVATSDTQTATVSPDDGHPAGATITVPTATANSRPTSGDRKDRASASLDLRYVIGSDTEPDRFVFDYTTTTSAVAADQDFGSGLQKADAFARVTVKVRSTAPLLAADFPGASFRIPDIPALTHPASETAIATFRIPGAGRPPETATSYVAPNTGFLTAGNPGVLFFLDMLPATPQHGDETLDYTFSYEVVTPFRSDPTFSYMLEGEAGLSRTIVTNTNDSGPGSLRQALLDVPDTGAITFDPDLDGQTINLTSGQLEVSQRDFAINANDLQDKVTIDADDLSRVLQVTNNSDLRLHNLTLTDGSVRRTDRGGGILVQDSALALTDSCVLDNRAAGNGGGIASDRSALRLVRTVVQGNSTDGLGGGVVTNRGALTSAEVVLIDSEFASNTALSGGAVTWDGTHISDFQFTRCSFIGNQADERGGALYRVKDPIDHCTFSHNTAGLRGGAIYQVNDTEIRHCTITNNMAPAGEGSGVYVGAGATTVFSSIIAGNGVSDFDENPGAGSLFSAGFNKVGTGKGVGAFTAGGDVTRIDNPRLTSPGNFGGPTTTLLPLYNSPATDAGATDLNSPNIDQRGFPRVADGDGNGTSLPDAGAAETEQQLIVVTNGNDSGPGSLRQALLDVLNGGLIIFDSSVQFIELTSGELVIPARKTFTIDGTILHPEEKVRISANLNSRVVLVEGAADLTLRGLWLFRGDAQKSGGSFKGGGILNGGTLQLFDCEISECEGGLAGGALWNVTSATVNMTRCTVRDNSAGVGGGLSNTGALFVVDSTIVGNRATSSGGGLSMADSDQATTLNRCVIGNNVANSGGGAKLEAGTLIVRDSSFHGNYARSAGGGLFLGGIGSSLRDARALLNHCTFWGNIADQGGALATLGGAVDLRYSTVSGNEAARGGGIHMDRGLVNDPDYALTVHSSIIAGNSTDDLTNTAGEVVSNGYNVIGLGSGPGLFSGPGDQTGIADPILSPPGHYGGNLLTLLPLPGSPALESGARGGIQPAFDQRGEPRLRDGDGDGQAFLDSGAAESPLPATTQLVLNTSDSGAGSLRRAIDRASVPGTRIAFDDSLKGETLVLSSGPLVIGGKHLLIDARNLSAGFTIRGDGATTVLVTAEDAAASLQNITLQNGGALSPNSPGGGIISEGSLTLDGCRVLANVSSGSEGAGIRASGHDSAFLILTDCEVAENRTDATESGGGLYLSNLNAILIDCAIRNNNADRAYGGGLVNSQGHALLRQCEVSGNRARQGAGLSSSGLTVVTRSTLAGNEADLDGGALFNRGGVLYVLDSTFSSNRARDGGAFHNGFPLTAHRSAEMMQCTFFSNNATRHGGAVFCDHGSLEINRSTIAFNHATASGSGVAVVGDPRAEIRFSSTIVADNPGIDLEVVEGASDQFRSDGFNLIGQLLGTSAFAGPGDTVGVLDPVLSDPGFYGGPTQTIIPLSGSPARDRAGFGSSAFDQRGFPRLFGPAIDIGAYEASGQGGYPVWAQELIPPGEDMSFAGNADGDCNPNGLEYGVHTDPDRSDPGSPNNAVVGEKEGIMRIDFGFQPSAFDVIWRVVRSTNLQNWAEIYRYDGTTETLAPGIDSDFDLHDRHITVDDTNPPAPEAYYRLEVVYTP